MAERLDARLGHILEGLAAEADPMESTTLAQVGEHIAKAFGVRPDEVGILVVTGQEKFLKFIIPEKLQMIGTIPVSSPNALAARTARDKRAEVLNNFTTTRHASVFEGVPMGRRHGELIHKIMSAPILVDDKVVGVVQISRKGRTAADAGPDFTQSDLRDLTSVTGAIGRFISLCKVS